MRSENNPNYRKVYINLDEDSHRKLRLLAALNDEKVAYYSQQIMQDFILQEYIKEFSSPKK